MEYATGKHATRVSAEAPEHETSTLATTTLRTIECKPEKSFPHRK